MRRFWTSTNRDELVLFANLLKTHGIKATLETDKEVDWGKEEYGTVFFSLWINHDNDIPKAKELFESFSSQAQSACHPLCQNATPLKKFIDYSFHIREKETKPHSFPLVTYVFLLLCILSFIGSSIGSTPDTFSPMQKYLLFDDPASSLTNTGWNGIFGAFDSTHPHTLFTSIREGQIWRLFSPILLHGNLVHLVLNMIWFISLGSMIEPRVRAHKYLILMAIIAAISNTAQYIVSGPAFLGISGVICGMAGFISSRQHKAPWEAYPLQPQLYQFLLFSIGLLVAVSVVMFLLSFRGIYFPIGFGNTSHISGLLAGKWLGQLSFFSTTKRSTIIKSS